MYTTPHRHQHENTSHTITSAPSLQRLSCLDKKVGLVRNTERLNGILLDTLGEDIPEEGSNIAEGWLAVPLCLRILGPGNIKERSRWWYEKARRGVSMEKIREVEEAHCVTVHAFWHITSAAHTWYLHHGTKPKVVREQLSIHRRTHQDDLEVRSLWQQVTQDHQQKVTVKTKTEPKGIRGCFYTMSWSSLNKLRTNETSYPAQE